MSSQSQSEDITQFGLLLYRLLHPQHVPPTQHGLLPHSSKKDLPVLSSPPPEKEGWKFEWEETDDTPDFIKELIAQCCSIDPAARPSFTLAILILGNGIPTVE